MKVRFATPDEITNWDKLLVKNPDGGNVFSSYEFAQQKETGGYKARFLMLDDLALTCLEKNAFPLGKFWYLPKGPNITTEKDLFRVLHALEPLGRQRGILGIRVESELPKALQASLERQGMRKARQIIPNPSTITLDISPKIDVIMDRLPQKGRYAIKRAEREHVKIKLVPSNNQNCQIMYKLLQATAAGQFGIRSYDYFRTFWQRFEKASLGQLFFAYYDGQVVAGAYAIVFGKKSTYKDGASIRHKTVYGASHLLQWGVIKWAKAHGATLHDFCGAPPSDQIHNTKHPHYKIGLFKTSFNKTVTDYIGCEDFIIRPLKYKIWVNFWEKVLQRLHFYKYHDSYY